MTDTKDTDNTGRRPLTLKRADSGTVKQSFSHGRSKTVVVETKRRAGAVPGHQRPQGFDVSRPRADQGGASAPRSNAPRGGPAGGARLAKAADQITLLDVYAAAGGDPKPSGCLLNHAVCRGDGCILGKTFREENERLFSLMKRTRLSTIAANAKINRPKP